MSDRKCFQKRKENITSKKKQQKLWIGRKANKQKHN